MLLLSGSKEDQDTKASRKAGGAAKFINVLNKKKTKTKNHSPCLQGQTTSPHKYTEINTD